jgi:hypothetical protein
VSSGLKRAGIGALIGLAPGVLIIATGLFIQEVLDRGGDGLPFFVIGVPLAVVGVVVGFILGAVDPHSPTGQTTIGAITGLIAGGLVAAAISFLMIEGPFGDAIPIWAGLSLGGFFLGGGYGYWHGHHGPPGAQPH